MNTLNHSVYVGSDGLLKFIYDDELSPLLQLGSSVVSRASHVEPVAGGWSADMGPSSGPVLGPFPLRRLALNAETQWLGERLEAQ